MYDHCFHVQRPITNHNHHVFARDGQIRDPYRAHMDTYIYEQSIRDLWRFSFIFIFGLRVKGLMAHISTILFHRPEDLKLNIFFLDKERLGE